MPWQRGSGPGALRVAAVADGDPRVAETVVPGDEVLEVNGARGDAAELLELSAPLPLPIRAVLKVTLRPWNLGGWPEVRRLLC